MSQQVTFDRRSSCSSANKVDVKTATIPVADGVDSLGLSTAGLATPW